MGASKSKQKQAAETTGENVVREREDIFKALFREMTGSVSGSTQLTVAAFIAEIQRNEPALQLMATLADGGSNIRNKALLKGDADALTEVFKAMDTNSDGDLTWAEWSKYVGARRNCVANKMFERLDTNAVGSVPVEKVVAAIKAEPTILELYNLNGCSAEKLVAEMDANGDGVISKEELQSLVKQVAAETPRKSHEPNEARRQAKAAAIASLQCLAATFVATDVEVQSTIAQMQKQVESLAGRVAPPVTPVEAS